MHCPQCKIRTLVSIEVVVSHQPLVMHSCSACDVRWWEGPEGRVSLSRVLDAASGRAGPPRA